MKKVYNDKTIEVAVFDSSCSEHICQKCAFRATMDCGERKSEAKANGECIIGCPDFLRRPQDRVHVSQAHEGEYQRIKNKYGEYEYRYVIKRKK